MKRILMIIILIIFAFTLGACENDRDNLYNSGDGKVIDDSSNTDQQPEKIELTLTELSAYDGKDGNMAYIAVNGKIYDVTDEWDNGSHKGIDAGNDVTEDIMNAPHGTNVLDDLEIIGDLIEE